MNDVILRPWRTEDRPQLAALWQQAFGDDRDYIDKFFAHFLTRGGCIVAQADEKVVSAMYMLVGPLLFPPEGNSLNTAYTYALVTDPAYRGRGIGTAVFRACVTAALEHADAACVLPSEPGLYDFYQKAVPCRPVSAVREASLSRDEIAPAPAEDAQLISVGEYYLRRKALLRGHPYAVMPGEYYAWERYHTHRFGGGLVSVDGDIAAVEMDGDTCRVLELLAPEGDWMDVMGPLSARFPARRYEIRTPLFLPGPGRERPFVLAAAGAGAACAMPGGLWWGFAFD